MKKLFATEINFRAFDRNATEFLNSEETPTQYEKDELEA